MGKFWIDQKQKIWGRKNFTIWVYYCVSEWVINFLTKKWGFLDFPKVENLFWFFDEILILRLDYTI